ncbi:MAG: CsbD family protein, partial [Candidatus Acidiferrales bacterium]
LWPGRASNPGEVREFLYHTHGARTDNAARSPYRVLASIIQPFGYGVHAPAGTFSLQAETSNLRPPKINCEGDWAMKNSTSDRIKGKAHEVKGKVKEKVGRATNNPGLEDQGQGEKIGGKVQKKIGQIEKVLED